MEGAARRVERARPASMGTPERKSPGGSEPPGQRDETIRRLERPAGAERRLARADQGRGRLVLHRLQADDPVRNAVLEVGDGGGVEQVRDVGVDGEAVLARAEPEDLLEADVQ